MDTISLILIGISIVLFLLSFFQKDKTSELQKEVDQLSMNMLQEQYSTNKRIKVLEEELLISNSFAIPKQESKIRPNKILINQVMSLANQGLPIDQISNQSSLPVNVVDDILQGRIK